MKPYFSVTKASMLLIIGLLFSAYESNAQCNFKTEYNSPFGWLNVGTSIGISGGSLNFTHTPGSPQTEHFYRQTACALNDDNWSAQFSFRLDTGNLMGHALLYLSDDAVNPSSSPGIGVYAYSGAGNPPQLVLMARDNSNFYTTIGVATPIEIDQDSIYHIVLERLNTGSARLSVFKDSLLQNPVVGSPHNLSFPGQNINDLDYVVHGNNNQLPGVDFMTGSIDYLHILDGCSAQLIGQDTVCSGKNFTYELNLANTYQWNTGEASQQITRSFNSDQLLIGTITDTNLCSASDTLFIKVNTAPDADFNVSDNSSSTVPFNVNFTNLSSDANKWFWDFGDGATSQSKNPSHTYNSYGIYSPMLVAMDSMSGCTDTTYEQIRIEVITADFTSEATVGCGSTVIQFEDLSTGVITNWFWVFGNGSISTDRHPVAIYPNPGTYQVSLTVTDGVNTDTRTINGYIQIGTEASAPVVEFTADTTNTCTNELTVQFSDLSLNANAWFWEFGDGDTSYQQNPLHHYDSPGSYSVRLQVTNTLGCVRDTTYSDYIVIDPPIANFTASPSNACGPFSTNFQDLSYSSNPIANWYWEFGDGLTDTTQNPTHLYATTGVYIATLTIEDVIGCSNVFSDTIRSGSIKPDADFTATPSRVCIGESVQFTDQSVDANQWYWDFGDGAALITQQNPMYSFVDTGNYTVTLIACNDGCCDTISKMQDIEVIEPIAVFSADKSVGCSIPHQVQFNDESFSPSNWYWDFGDGNTSIQENPQHVYQDIGIYEVKLIVQDTFTLCTDTFTSSINIDTAHTNLAAFPLNGCTPMTVQFADNSRNPVAWNWDFGNGNTSSLENPLHTYTDSGTYNITLVTEIQNGCKDTLLRKDMITVVEPDIKISASAQSGCAPFTVQFDNLTNGTASQLWNFGNGDSSVLKAPNYTFTSPGIYDITLRVLDANGCTSTEVFVQYIEVFDLPSLTISTDTQVCYGSEIDIFASGANTYNWNNGLAGDSIRLSIYTDSTLILTAADSNSCLDSDTVNIKALALPNASAGVNDSICLGESGALNASGGIQYMWNNGTPIAQLTETVLTTTMFTVEVTDSNSCSASDSAYIVVRVQPLADAGGNDTICLGETGQLVGSGTGSLNWSNGDVGSLMTDNPLITSDYILTVTDVYNCISYDTASIYVDDFKNAGILKSDTICQGDTAVLEAYGGISYTWSNGDGTAQISVLPTSNTIYRVTITNSLGCTLIDSIEVLVNPTPVLNIPDASFCLGGYTILNANVGPGATYQWSTGSITDTIKVHSTGQFTVIAETVFGCFAYDTVQTSIDTALIVNLISDSLCDGQVYVLNAGNTGATYLWNTGDTTQTISVTQNGTFNVEVTDPFGCMGLDTAKVLFYSNPIANAGSDLNICESDTAILIASGGVGYSWSNGDTTAQTKVSPTSDQNYIVEVFNQFGCNDFDTVLVEIENLPQLILSSDTSVCEGNFVLLNASGADTYLWSNGESGNSIFVEVNSDSLFIVTGTNAFGCSSIDSIALQSVALPSITISNDTSVCSGSPVLLEATGAANYTWSNGDIGSQIMINPVVSQSYTLTTTNIQGCEAIEDVFVNVYSLPIFQLSDQTFCTGGGTTLMGPSGNYSYNWSTGDTTENIFVNTSGDYSLYVTDSNLCVYSDTAEISDSSVLVINIPDQDICSGQTAMLDAGYPGANYLWSTGDTSALISTDTGAIFTVFVQDTFGCVGYDTIEVQLFGNPLVSIGNDTSVCEGSLLSFTYSQTGTSIWNGSDTVSIYSLNAIEDTLISLYYTDTNSCIGFDTVQIGVYKNPSLGLFAPDSACLNSELTLTAVGNGSLSWFNNDTSLSTVVVLSQSRYYQAQITDSNSCVTMDSIYVKALQLPQPYAGNDTFVCFGDTINIIGSAQNFNVSFWNTGDSTLDITLSPALSGNLILFEIDSNNCVGSDTALLEVSALPLIKFNGLKSKYCSGDSIAILDIQPSGGSLTGLGILGFTFHPYAVPLDTLLTITYEITDSFGCSNSKEKTTIVYPLPEPELSISDTGFCESLIPVSLSGSPFGGRFLGPGVSNDKFVPFYAGAGRHILQYSFTDSNQCVATDSKFVTVYPLPQPVIDTLPAEVCIDAPALEIGLSHTGGVLQGKGLSGDSLFVPTLAGIGGPYALVYSYTDSNNCTNFTYHEITVKALPILNFTGLKDAYCSSVDTVKLKASPAGGYFSGVGVDSSTSSLVFDSIVTQSIVSYHYTDTNGLCSNTIRKTVNQYAGTPVEFTNANDSICSNTDYVQLEAFPAGGVFSGEGVINTTFRPQNLKSDSFYSIYYTYTDSNNCISSDTATYYLRSIPNVSILNTDSFYCAGEIDLIVSHEGGYFSGMGQYNGVLHPEDFLPGFYKVEYTYIDQFDCVVMTEKEFEFGNCTSIDDNLITEAPMVYPNPFNTFIKVETGTIGKGVIQLSDVNGKILMEQKISSVQKSITLQLSEYLSEGVYFLSVISDNQQYTKKLIKRVD